MCHVEKGIPGYHTVCREDIFKDFHKKKYIIFNIHM